MAECDLERTLLKGGARTRRTIGVCTVTCTNVNVTNPMIMLEPVMDTLEMLTPEINELKL